MGHVAHTEERRGVYMVLIRKPEGKVPLGRTRHRRLIIFKKVFLRLVRWGRGMD
jgi:hypothetical protein